MYCYFLFPEPLVGEMPILKKNLSLKEKINFFCEEVNNKVLNYCENVLVSLKVNLTGLIW